jgi:hypothetical protein
MVEPTNAQWAEALEAFAAFSTRGSYLLDRDPDGGARRRRIGGWVYQKLARVEVATDPAKRAAAVTRLVAHMFESIDGPPPGVDNAPALGGNLA